MDAVFGSWFGVWVWVSLVVFYQFDVLVDLEDVVELADVDLVVELRDHGDPEGMEFVVRTDDVIHFVKWPWSPDSMSNLQLC